MDTVPAGWLALILIITIMFLPVLLFTAKGKLKTVVHILQAVLFVLGIILIIVKLLSK